jgi:hypothetical protein
MSHVSYDKTVTVYRRVIPAPSLSHFIQQLPHVTISEIEALAVTNRHLVEQIPRYISQMVSYECRLIGF